MQIKKCLKQDIASVSSKASSSLEGASETGGASDPGESSESAYRHSMTGASNNVNAVHRLWALWKLQSVSEHVGAKNL